MVFVRFGITLLLATCALALVASPSLALTLSDNEADLVVDDSALDNFGFIDADLRIGGVSVVHQVLGFSAAGVEGGSEGGVDTNELIDNRDDATSFLVLTQGAPPVNRVALVSVLLRGSIFDSSQADVAETLEVSNTSSSTVSFFQFVEFPGPGSIQQLDPNTWRYTSSDLFFEEVVTPRWDRVVFESDGTGYALLWDIAPGETRLIGKDKRVVVPEATAGALMSLGLSGLLWAGRRRDAT